MKYNKDENFQETLTQAIQSNLFGDVEAFVTINTPTPPAGYAHSANPNMILANT